MIWRNKPLADLTDKEFTEAVLQNNRFAAVALHPDCNRAVYKAWRKKAVALRNEGIRRGHLVAESAA